MKLGIENKKQLGFLIVLAVVAGYMVYSQFLAGPSYTPAPAAKTSDTAATEPVVPEKSSPDIARAPQQTPARPTSSSKGNDFHPVLRSKKKEDRNTTIGKIDPTLRFDLIEKVMQVPPAGGERDLFTISKTPPIKEVAMVQGPEPKVHLFQGPLAPPPPPAPRPPDAPPPPQPIPLKYYGYTNERPDGKRTAYFLDGDDGPLEAIEGTTLEGRYRIVQIGLEKVLVEDTKEKRRQSINLEPEAGG
jgi:hypothetical protein